MTHPYAVLGGGKGQGEIHSASVRVPRPAYLEKRQDSGDCFDGLYYELHGHGPKKMLLVMGLAAVHVQWEPQIAALGIERASEYTVCVMDNRGVGFTTRSPAGVWRTRDLAADCLGLINHLAASSAEHGAGPAWGPAEDGGTGVHVIGFSMGGMVALELALLCPSRLASLTLISTHAGGVVGTLPPVDGIGKFLACFSSLGGVGAVDAGLDMLFPTTFLDRRQKRRQRFFTADSFLPVRPAPVAAGAGAGAAGARAGAAGATLPGFGDDRTISGAPYAGGGTGREQDGRASVRATNGAVAATTPPPSPAAVPAYSPGESARSALAVPWKPVQAMQEVVPRSEGALRTDTVRYACARSLILRARKYVESGVFPEMTLVGLVKQLGAVMLHYVSWRRLRALGAYTRSGLLPVLVIAGKLDNLVHHRNAALLARALGADPLVFADGAHAVNEQYADVVNCRIRRVVERAQAAWQQSQSRGERTAARMDRAGGLKPGFHPYLVAAVALVATRLAVGARRRGQSWAWWASPYLAAVVGAGVAGGGWRLE